MANIEQLKSEISDKYLDDFKNELWTIKSLVLLPIKKDIKKILTGQADLPQKFDEVKEFGRWKDIINFVTPDIASQIFAFMKEKRTQIETRKTEAELEELKQEIISGVKSESDGKSQISDPISPQDNGQSSQEQQNEQRLSEQQDQLSKTTQEKDSEEEKESSPAKSVAIGVGAGATGLGMTYGLDKLVKAREKRAITKNLSPEQIKFQLESTMETLKNQRIALASRFSQKQLKTLDKNISELSKGFADFDKETVDLLKIRDNVWGKIPNNLLAKLRLDPKTFKKMSQLSGELVGKSPEEIKIILKSNQLLDVGDDVVKVLSKAGSKAELESMCVLFSRGTKLSRAIKTFKGAMLFDMAFLGLDVYQYIEDNKEADLIAKVNELRADKKYTRANTQLTIAVTSVAVEALLVCTSLGSMWGPVGTLIWLGVWALSAAAAIGVDSLYFDVQDFYLQNKEDFIRQKKAQLNQAILQGLHNQKKWNDSLNEKIGSPEPSQREQTLNEAIWSMLFVDEIENWTLQSSQLLIAYLQSWKKKSDFIAGLSSEEEKAQFDVDRKSAEKIIDQRMNYLKPHFSGNQIMQKLGKWEGMQYLNDLINQSRVYSTLKSQNKRDDKLDYSKNLENYQKELLKAFKPEKVQKFKNLEKNSPELYQEILVTVNLSSLLCEDEADKNYTENVQLVKAIQDFKKLTVWDTFSHLQIPDSNKNVAFVENLLRNDFDLTKVQYPRMSKDSLTMMIQINQERRWNLNISEDPMQNVMYRLASELYGYTGPNEKSELMAFFSEDQGNVHGVYYSSQRMLNRDWAVDGNGWLFKKGINTDFPTAFPANQLDAKVNQVMKEYSTWTSSIDTPTEAIDGALQKEFENKIRAIVKSELSYRTIEKQNEVKNQISTFVSKNAKEGEYLELPYYLLMQAKRSGLWDLQRQFYTVKNKKIETVFLKSELNDKKAMETSVAYLTQQREKYSDQEQSLISRVESAHKELAQLLSVESTFSKEDELDLPREIEVMIADKYKDRQKFKTEVLYYDASTIGTSEILNKYEEFATYFENLYTGMLLSLSSFKATNDIDSFWLYSWALRAGNGDFFREDGNLDEAKLKNFPYLQESKVKDYYSSALKTQKIWSKSIEELRKSEDSKEKAIWLQASKLILATMLGESLLGEPLFGKNKQGKIARIKIWSNKFDSDATSSLSKPDELSEKISQRLQKLWNVTLLDPQKVQNLISSSVQIKELNQRQKETIKQTSPLQQKIEKTLPNVVWQGKRGNITYDPDKSLLKSRGQKIELKEKSGKYYLQDLDYPLSLNDALWLANFANWAKQNYKWVKIAFERELLHDALVVKDQGVTGDDIEIISQDTLKTHCSAAKDDTFCTRIAIWLTNVVK